MSCAYQQLQIITLLNWRLLLCTCMCHGTPCMQIMDQIEGVNGEMLPWEGERLTPQVRSQLRLFQDALLQLLHRDPLQRPSMAQFCRTYTLPHVCTHPRGAVCCRQRRVHKFVIGSPGSLLMEASLWVLGATQSDTIVAVES